MRWKSIDELDNVVLQNMADKFGTYIAQFLFMNFTLNRYTTLASIKLLTYDSNLLIAL